MSFAKLKKSFVLLLVTCLLVSCVFVPAVAAAEEDDTEEVTAEVETDEVEEDEADAGAAKAEEAAPAATTTAAPVVYAPVVAPVVVPEYDFEIKGLENELEFYYGEKLVYTIDMPQTAIEFTTIKTGETVIYVANNEGVRKALNLGNPTKLLLSGTMAKVDIGPNLEPGVTFDVKAGTYISTLTAHSKADINVEGRVHTIVMFAPSPVVAKADSNISRVELHTMDATLKVEQGANVTSAFTTNGIKSINGYKNIGFIGKLTTRNDKDLRTRY